MKVMQTLVVFVVENLEDYGVFKAGLFVEFVNVVSDFWDGKVAVELDIHGADESPAEWFFALACWREALADSGGVLVKGDQE